MLFFKAAKLTYDEFIILGPANSFWTAEQLASVDYDEVLNSLEVLGSVPDWTEPQASALLTSLETVSYLFYEIKKI